MPCLFFFFFPKATCFRYELSRFCKLTITQWVINFKHPSFLKAMWQRHFRLGQLLLHKWVLLPSYYLRLSLCCRWMFTQKFLLLRQQRATGELRCPAYGKSRKNAVLYLIKPKKNLSKKNREKETKCWIVILSPVESSSFVLLPAKAESSWHLAESEEHLAGTQG